MNTDTTIDIRVANGVPFPRSRGRQVMKTCLTLPLEFPVTLEQRADGRFRVTYGQQVKDRLSYADAARELGECILHALACAGKLDNEH